MSDPGQFLPKDLTELDSTAVSAAPSNGDHSAVRVADIDDDQSSVNECSGRRPHAALPDSQAARGGSDPSTTLPQPSVVGRAPPAPLSPPIRCVHTARKEASSVSTANIPEMEESRSSGGKGCPVARLPESPDDDLPVFSKAEPPADCPRGDGGSGHGGDVLLQLPASSDRECLPAAKPALVKRNSSTLQSISEEEMLDIMERTDMQEVLSSLPPCQCDDCLLNEGEASSASPGAAAAKPHAVLKRVTFPFFSFPAC